MAAVGFRSSDAVVLDARLARAGRKLGRAPLAAVIEHALLRARIHDPDGAWLAAAAERLEVGVLGPEDAACYIARFLDATAYREMRAGASFAAGRLRYESIPENSGVPFVDFRRALGIAYCAWKSGDSKDALNRALEAAGRAGDGGFVRFRVMAFNLASRIAEGEEAARLGERARRLSVRLEDEELLARVHKAR